MIWQRAKENKYENLCTENKNYSGVHCEIHCLEYRMYKKAMRSSLQYGGGQAWTLTERNRNQIIATETKVLRKTQEYI